MAMTLEELIMEQIMNSLEQNAAQVCGEPCRVEVHAMTLDEFNNFIREQEEKAKNTTKKCSAPCNACDKESMAETQQPKQVKTPKVEHVYIENVLFNQPATIVFWSDGTKTVSLCHEKDNYSKATGLTLCICKKLIGNQVFHDIIEQWCPGSYDNTEPEKPIVKVVANKETAKKPANKTTAKKPASKTTAKKPAGKSTAKKPASKTTAKKPAGKNAEVKETAENKNAEEKTKE